MSSKTMKIITLTDKKTFAFSDAPVPECKNGEVLIKVLRMGICGSDLHAYGGAHPYMSFPIVLGHEMSGVVEAWGSEAHGFKKGDKVTIMPQLKCGSCPQCQSGRYNICESLKVIGCQTQGASAEYLICPKDMVKKLPDEMDLDTAAMIEPASVGVHAVRRLGSVLGKSIVVLGAGTIGNLCAQAAKALGAEKILISDLSDYRLSVAESCGIKNTVNPSAKNSNPSYWDEALAEAIDQTSGPRGADIIFECVGIESTAAQSIKVSKKGRDIVILGVFGKPATVDMGLVQDKELRIVGSLMYTAEDYDAAIEFIMNGKLKVAPLLSGKFLFSDYAEAFKAIETDGEKMLKVIIEIN